MAAVCHMTTPPPHSCPLKNNECMTPLPKGEHIFSIFGWAIPLSDLKTTQDMQHRTVVMSYPVEIYII